MSRYGLRVDTATREVVGHWVGGNAGELPASTPEKEFREVSLPVFQQCAQALRHRGGGPRWRMTPGGQVQEITDSRPIVRFTPDTVELTVGDPPGQVLMEVVDENGNVRTNVNTTRRVRLTEQKSIRLTFVNGATTVNVPTNAPRTFVVGDNAQFRVVAPLTVEVDDNEL